MFGYDTGYISVCIADIGTDLSNKVPHIGRKEFITLLSPRRWGRCWVHLLAVLLPIWWGEKGHFGLQCLLVGTIIQLAAHTVWTMIVGKLDSGQRRLHR